MTCFTTKQAPTNVTINAHPTIIAILLFSIPVCLTNPVTSANVEPSLFKTITDPFVTVPFTDVLADTSETNFFKSALAFSDSLDINELLKIINHPTCGKVYEINEDF